MSSGVWVAFVSADVRRSNEVAEFDPRTGRQIGPPIGIGRDIPIRTAVAVRRRQVWLVSDTDGVLVRLDLR
jgi:hypothetical protein